MSVIDPDSAEACLPHRLRESSAAQVSPELQAFIRQLKPGMEVFVAGCAGESTALLHALQSLSPCCEGVRFTGVQIPGVNTFSYAELSPSTRQRCFFLSEALRPAFAAGRVEYLPLTYTGIWDFLSRQSFDWVIFQGALPVSAGAMPGASAMSSSAISGDVSLGIAADFTPAVVKKAQKVLALLNPMMPASHAHIAAADIDLRIVAPAPLLNYDAGAISSSLMVLGKIIADEIPNGATLQFGLGKLQTALLRNLRHHRGLRIHSGMVSDAVLSLLDSHALAAPDPGSPPITTGVALGSDDLYQRMCDPAIAQFAHVGYTHHSKTLASLSQFISINSIIEIDLSGQVNGESLAGKQISGGGGMADFVLGGRLGWQSKSILATPATAANGSISRIRVTLDPGTPVTVARHDVDTVATEFGVAKLRNLDLDQRAEALIAIADPQFRDGLAREYQTMRTRR